jgi:hypothetical protein
MALPPAGFAFDANRAAIVTAHCAPDFTHAIRDLDLP